jgi:hypothetical protein
MVMYRFGINITINIVALPLKQKEIKPVAKVIGKNSF